MRCFYTTAVENLPEIEQEGLIPAIGTREGEDFPAVWVFPSPEQLNDALWNWLGEELFEEDEEAAVALIAVELPPELECLGEPDTHFMLAVTETIPPACLTVLTRDLGSVEDVMKLCEVG